MYQELVLKKREFNASLYIYIYIYIKFDLWIYIKNIKYKFPN